MNHCSSCNTLTKASFLERPISCNHTVCKVCIRKWPTTKGAHDHTSYHLEELCKRCYDIRCRYESVISEECKKALSLNDNNSNVNRSKKRITRRKNKKDNSQLSSHRTDANLEIEYTLRHSEYVNPKRDISYLPEYTKSRINEEHEKLLDTHLSNAQAIENETIENSGLCCTIQ